MTEPFDYAWDYGDFPLAYLITIRSYGTWLHGDKRGSVDRHGYNTYGTPCRRPDPDLLLQMQRNLKHPPTIFNKRQRESIEVTIAEVCKNRGYTLMAVNPRSNHVHIVVSAQLKPEPIRNAFKSYATRNLRRNGLIDPAIKPWARRGSRRYLWKGDKVALAIEYTLYGQGNIVPLFGDFSEPGDDWD